jgi:hypothetical protein
MKHLLLSLVAVGAIWALADKATAQCCPTAYYQPVTTCYAPVTTYYAPAPVYYAPAAYPVTYRRPFWGRYRTTYYAPPVMAWGY